MSNKPKLAIYWAASCGGCEISILAIDEKILDVGAAFDLVFCPCIADGKVHDIEKMADGEITVTLFNGGIRTSENEYMAQLLRRKSQVLVAFGSCATEGCVPGLGNMNTKQEIFQTNYHDNGTLTSTENPNRVEPQTETKVPEGTLYLPMLYDTLKTLDQTVEVDYYLPGCPPEADRIWAAIEAIVAGKLPAKGSVLGPHTTVCDECKRTKTEKKIKAFKRVWEIIPDEETCLLEQGLLCCGVATRAGCGALCPKVNSPCIGCHGPNEGAADYGSRLIAALGSVIDSEDPAEIDAIIEKGIPDPVGQLYRFCLAGSLLRRKKKTAVAK
jgi:F420-non-reducing hydrogenase small subunit